MCIVWSRKCSQFFRTWTEESWRGECEANQRVWPAALALVTGLLYALYFTLYALYGVVLWAIEPLAAELDDKRSAADLRARDHTRDHTPPRVTNYDDDAKSAAHTPTHTA